MARSCTSIRRRRRPSTGSAFPYMYAAADSTPLFLMAVADYVRASGDVAFLTAHRDAIEKAWAFETDPAHDTDHDGIYDNSQGTGWVESWPTAACRTRRFIWRCWISRPRRRWRRLRSCCRIRQKQKPRSGARGDDCQDNQCRVFRSGEGLLRVQPQYADGLAGPHHDGVSGDGVVGSGKRQSDSCATFRLPIAVCGHDAEYGLGPARCVRTTRSFTTG